MEAMSEDLAVSVSRWPVRLGHFQVRWHSI